MTTQTDTPDAQALLERVRALHAVAATRESYFACTAWGDLCYDALLPLLEAASHIAACRCCANEGVNVCDAGLALINRALVHVAETLGEEQDG